MTVPKNVKRLVTRHRRLFIAVGLISAVLFILPESANAIFGIDLSPAGLVTMGFRVITSILSFVIGIAYMVASYFVEFILNLNYGILNTQNTIVDIGWRIVRDVANLGFVLVIIVMAFATILRIESYGAKKLLVHLIAAAIIVNFSLTIAGVFIDFSHSLTRFFLEGGLGASATKDLVLDLGAAFGPQRFSLGDQDPAPPDPSEQTGFWTSFSTAVLVSIAGGIFSVVFMLIATLVMATLALMLLIRYLVLSFLLILAPLAWLFWVIPALQGQFTKWWNKFFEWVFFAPAVSFFIYLSIVSVKALGSSPLPTLGGIPGVLTTVISQGAQMVVLAGIMIGGIIVAQKMGIAGAAGAMGIAKKVGKGAQAWAGRKAIRAGTYPLRSKLGRDATEGLQKIGEHWGEGGGIRGAIGKMFKIGVAPLRQAGTALSTARMKGEKTSVDFDKDVAGRSIEENRRRLASAPPEEQAAILRFFRKLEKGMEDKGDTTNPAYIAVKKALQEAPKNILDKETRLAFLYGGGGKAGEEYGVKIPFFERQKPGEARPETRAKKGAEQTIKELIDEAAKEQQKGGGAPKKEGGGEKPPTATQ